MCVAVPGEVLQIEGDIATVDFQGNRVRVSLGLVDAKIGDHVLVHAGCAIEVMQKEQADELNLLLAELDEVLAPERAAHSDWEARP